MPPERETRGLSAILAADMVGYSRLMAADEAGTVARLKTYRLEIVDPAIARHQGRIVKTAGDGMIVEFASVVGAVDCAVEVQGHIARRNADMPPDQKIEFRVGINLGDVIVDGDDILGDGVNIAARLEALAEPGGIVISGTARDTLRDNLGQALDDLGEVEVKNIPRPVRVFRVRHDAAAPAARPAVAWHRPALAAGAATAAVLAGLAWQPWAERAPVAVRQAQAPAAGPIPALAVAVPQLPASIAPPVVGERAALIVLPFSNLSGDPNQEFFSDGITEDVTTALARIPGLRVMARNTAFVFKGKAVDARAVGRELGVRYMLEGSVQKKAGERIRLNAELIETASGEHVWAERYDRQLADVFVVQDELVDRVVGTVASQLRRREGERALAAPVEKLQAYELAMRARLLWRTSGLQ